MSCADLVIFLAGCSYWEVRGKGRFGQGCLIRCWVVRLRMMTFLRSRRFTVMSLLISWDICLVKITRRVRAMSF